MRLSMRRKSLIKRLLRLFFTGAASLFLAAEANAQITTNTALPISSGGGIFRVQTKVVRSSSDMTGERRQLTVLMIPLVVAYGVTPKLAAFGIVSILNKQFEFTGENGRTERSVSGLADTRVFLRYTVIQKDARGATLRFAPFAGTQLPTGSKDASDEMGLLPRPLQLGTGSWNPFVGAVLTRQTLAWQVDATITYQFNSAIDGFRFGNEARFDLATKIRLLPRSLGGGLPRFLYANLESNLIWRGRNEINRLENEDSGGAVLYVDPGFQLISRLMVIETAVQIPVAQDINGAGLENDYIFVVSIRIAF